MFFDGERKDPRTVPFCEKQLKEWGTLDMAACLENEPEIEEMIKDYKVGTIVILLIKTFADIQLLA